MNRRAARAAARVLVVPAALAALAVTAPQAAAHTELESGSPAANAVLAGLPPRATLTFTDEMTEKYAKVAVTGADGSSVATGNPQVDGKTVTLALRTDAPAGGYTVGYRVVSADGHPVSGSYTFTVKPTDTAQPSAPATGGPAPSSGAAAPTASASAQTAEPASSGVSAPVLATGGALAVAAGATVFAVRRRRRAGRGD
ncbi:hypothetical protein NI25_07395 [Streptomyces sp. CCM_MD2014]|nr:hypothetical protein NI25_07395 [Streptomyces sp. CCM_MD2014]